MDEVIERFQGLDSLEMPDVWTEALSREPSPPSPPPTGRRLAIAAFILGLAVVAIVFSAFRGTERGDTGAGSCASLIVFEGNRYLGRGVGVQPVPGEILGVAVMPACDDTGQGSGGPDERIEVAALPGVEPTTAVVEADDPGSTIFIRDGIDQLPPELTAYFEAPTCRPGDAPIGLEGTWLGILGTDGHTELDMDPPYDVDMLVEHSTVTRYERAYLTIGVPTSLGRPLTREDVRTSLWEGGGIQITASCSGDLFVAQRIEAFPP